MNTDLEKLRIDKSHKARRDQRSSWPWILVILLLIGGGAGAWFTFARAAVAQVQTIRVRVSETATTRNDRVVLNATGYVRAAHKIELASKVVGRVAWVGVEMGDKIKKGQELVRLEDDEYRARVAQQQGQFENSKAKLAQAEANWNRAKSLGPSEALAQSQFDLYKAEFEMARANVTISEAMLTLARLDLDNTTIRATVDATVLSRNVEVGEFVTTGFVGDRGAKGFVVSIADLNDLQVELDISQNDFAKVSPRQPCWVVTDAYPDRKYEGIVDLISPEANRQKATVQVRIKVLNPDDLLKPDMNATVSFLSMQKSGPTTAAEAQPAVRVPASTIQAGSVFVVENGKAVKRPITPGLATTDGQVEIRKGLIGGEDLIVSPPQALRDGDAVRIQTAN